MRTQPLNFEEFTWTVFLSESETRIYELKASMASSYKQEGHQFVQKYFEIVTITRFTNLQVHNYFIDALITRSNPTKTSGTPKICDDSTLC